MPPTIHNNAAGRAVDGMAYWDVVAALSTPPDVVEWVTTIRDQGRGDLDGATLTARRDDDARHVLDQVF